MTIAASFPGDVEKGAYPPSSLHPPLDCNATPPAVEEEIARTPTQASYTPQRKLAALAKTLTARSNASVIDPGPPPDGGSKAWTQACMGHLVILNSWGMIATFGVFQTYYTSELGMEPSAVSWIGSMQMLGHFGLGTFNTL